MAIDFYDTSAVLNLNLLELDEGYISPLTLMELENIKDSNKPEGLKYASRQAVRTIIHSNILKTSLFPQNKVEKLLKKYPFLQNINDHKLICEAELLARELHEDVNFITADGAQYLFACQMPHLNATFLGNKNFEEDLENYTGWSKHYPDEQTLSLLYQNPKINVLNCRNNEFAEIFVDKQLKDILFWTGESYRPLKYKEFTTALGERIAPRNIEQKMYLDLLQNDNIPIKLCIGRFGTGKSMFAETWALSQLQLGKYDKIVFVKNNLEVKGAGTLGTLPGDEIDKQYPWLKQIEDHLGPQIFEDCLQDGRIEPVHLSTLRGRDLKHSLILVDEAENLLVSNIQLLLGRVAEGSEIIFCADVKQCDYKDSKMSGIPKLITSLAGNPLFGMVKLIKTERSPIAATADLLD